MESFGGFGFNNMSKTIRKKRSNSSRRPRNDSQPFVDCGDNSSLSSTPHSDSVSRASSDDNKRRGTNSWKKELSLNQCNTRASSTNLVEAETALRMNNNDAKGGESKETRRKRSSESKEGGKDSKRFSEAVLAVANRKSVSKVKGSVELQSESIECPISRRVSGRYSSSPCGRSEVASDGPESNTKVKTVKLKVGGVTCMLHANSTYVGASVGGSSSAKSSHSSDAHRPRQKLILQDTSDGDRSSSPDKGGGLQGAPCHDFSRSSSSVMNANSLRGKKPEESVSTKQLEKYEPVRKSKRVPKRRLLDGVLADGDDDDELRFLERLKTSKVAKYSAEYEDDNKVGSKKQHNISKVLKRNVASDCNTDAGDYGSFRIGKEAKKSISGGASDDVDYVDDEEMVSDGEAETKRRKQRKDLVDVLRDSKRNTAITTRQRALQTGKDISFSSGASLIEFPNGLPPAAPRKQKEKLSEVDQQLKKAEAAQRRRMQVEKAARESEAEAIRKILGQESSRKKREDKMKKRQEELAQDRANSAMTLTSNTVRWVMGPTGTIVIFSDELGLPSIFEPKACSYPPPREKCAGPSCTNPYKYRDSKSKLPLCSLQCYKAVST